MRACCRSCSRSWSGAAAQHPCKAWRSSHARRSVATAAAGAPGCQEPWRRPTHEGTVPFHICIGLGSSAHRLLSALIRWASVAYDHTASRCWPCTCWKLSLCIADDQPASCSLAPISIIHSSCHHACMSEKKSFSCHSCNRCCLRRRWLLGLLVLQSASSAVLDMYQVAHPAAA